MTTEGGDDDLARQLQHHLDASAEQDRPTVQDSDVQVNVGNDPPAGTQTASAHPAWETFDDDGDQNRPVSKENVSTHLTEDSQQRSTQAQRNDDLPAAKEETRAPESTPNEVPRQSAADLPVSYDLRNGEVVVVTVERASDVSGQGAVIRTSHLQERGLHDMDEPLRPGRIRMLKIMSVVAAILFFPTGLPAVYLAWRIQAQFNEGILQGSIDRALKTARRSQHLAILSYVLCVVVVAITLAVVERSASGHSMDHSYVAHSSIHGRSV